MHSRYLCPFTIALLAFSIIGYSADDPAMVPAPVNTSPGAEYGDAARRFQGIPGIARAPGGRLWVTWYAGGTNEGPDNHVLLSTSSDDGKTWSPVQVVIDPPGMVRAYDPCIWTDPRGRIWLFYGQSFGWWDGRGGVWAVVTDEPDNPSPRWSAPRRIADGVMMNKPTVMRNGDWLLPIAVWSHEPRQSVPWDPTLHVPEEYLKWDPKRAGTHVYRSRDNGDSFDQLGTARVPDVVSDEHMIVERKDGSLWMLVRTGSTSNEAKANFTTKGISESISTDGGRTWSPGQPSSIPHIPSRFFIRRLASGRLLLVKHNPRMDTAWLRPPEVEAWQRRSHLTAYLSDNDGRSWYGGLLIDQRLVVSYPDAVEAADGRIFLVYDYNRKTDKEILMAVFTEEDVAAGKLIDPRSRLRQLVNQATGEAAAAAPAPLAAAGHAIRSLPRPNIVFIWADDLGYCDLGCYGHPRIQTPHLDRLAQEGTRFTQFYVSHSVCSPSRASAITGQYPARWNIHAHLAWLEDNAKRGMPDWLDAGAPSLPRALQQARYRTAHFGKWHLGGGSGRRFRGKAINSPDAPPVAAYGYDETRVDFGNGPTWKGTEPVDHPHDTYPYEDAPWVTWSSRLLADASIDFLARHVRNHPHRPFLLNLWLKDPHVPLAPTEEMRQPYADVTDEASRDYFAVITYMDAQIGRVLAALDELGLRENTLVLFSSDNGAPARQASADTGSIGGRPLHTAGSNAPLRGWKWHLHEGGIRVPLIARWPGRVPAARVDTASVLNLCDFTPTFTRLAGARMPEGYVSDGVDVTDALLGRPFVRGEHMFWQNRTANRRGPVLAIRDGNWKLLMEPDGTLAELYEIELDPTESNNLAEAHPEIVQRLTRQLRDWSRSLPPPLDRSQEAIGKQSRSAASAESSRGF